MIRRTIPLLALAALSLIGCRPPGVGGILGGGATTALITVPSRDLLYVLDLQTNRVANTLPTGDNPIGLAVSPDGTQILVANYSEGSVRAYWRSGSLEFEAIGDVATGARPLGVAFNPNPQIKEAYVAFEGDGKVVVLDTSASRQRPRIISQIQLPGTVRPAPRKIAVSPDGSRIYVTDGANDTVHSITRTGAQFSVSAGAPVQGGQANIDLWGVVATRDGRVIAANRAGSDLLVFDGGSNNVVGQINLTTSSSQINQAPIVGPANLAMNGQGTKLYAAGNAASVVSEILLGQGGGQLIQTVDLNTQRRDAATGPFGIAVTADGTAVYTANEGGYNLSIIQATPDPSGGAVLVRNAGTAASAGQLEPLGEIAIVGDALQTTTF